MYTITSPDSVTVALLLRLSPLKISGTLPPNGRLVDVRAVEIML